MKKIQTLTAALLASAVLAVPALSSELRIGLNDDADVLDPAQSRTFVGRIVYTAMCDKLVDISQDMKIVPQLATEWAWSEGGKVLTMKIRDGVKFHDGETLDAAAVVATIERNMTLPESRRKSELSSVEKVEATGPLDVKFTLKTPDVTLLAQLSDRAGMIVAPKAAKELGANFGSSRSAPDRSNSSSASSRTVSCWRNSPTIGTRTRSSSTRSFICQSPILP